MRISEFETILLPKEYNYLAPDKSEIRLLGSLAGGGMAHVTLPQGKVSQAVKHRTVEEIWYVVDGEGEMWRIHDEKESIEKLFNGICITIPVGTSFQFKNTGDRDLQILIATMPPWPGEDEAIIVENKF